MTRVIKIVGFLALAVLASSFLYADPVTCATTGGGISSICGANTLASNRLSFQNQAGYDWYDSINWTIDFDNDGVNQNPPCLGSYCYNPDPFPFGGTQSGGTNFSMGQVGNYVAGPASEAGLGLYNTGSFLGLPSGAGTILSEGSYIPGENNNDVNQATFYGGDAQGMYGFAMNFDPTNTDPLVNGIYGVGFDFQLGAGNTHTTPASTQAATSYSVTFEVFAPTANCAYTTDNVATAYGNIDNAAIMNCFDYQTGTTTSAGTYDPIANALSGATDNGTGAGALLGTITITSTSGVAGFFSVTSTSPIGTIFETSSSQVGGEGAGAFGLDQVDLLTQQSATPEPATLLLFGSGLLFAARRLRKSVAK